MLKESEKVKEDQEWKDMYAWMMEHDDEVREDQKKEIARKTRAYWNRFEYMT